MGIALRWTMAVMLAGSVWAAAQETVPDASVAAPPPAAYNPDQSVHQPALPDDRVANSRQAPAVDDWGEALPDNLEELFAIALQNNPDIRAAQAEVDAAMARADKLRGETLQQVAALHAQQRNIKATLDRMPPESTRRRQTEESLRATTDDLRATLGMGPMGMTVSPMMFGGGVHSESVIRVVAVPPQSNETSVRPTVDDETENRLSTSVSIEYGDTPLDDILMFFSEYLEYSIVCDPVLAEKKIPRIALKDVSFRQALLALSDIVPGTVFVIREYGIFATTREQAATLAAPSIPDIPLYEPAPPAALRLNHAAPRRVEIRKVAPPGGAVEEHRVELGIEVAPVPMETVLE